MISTMNREELREFVGASKRASALPNCTLGDTVVFSDPYPEVTAVALGADTFLVGTHAEMQARADAEKAERAQREAEWEAQHLAELRQMTKEELIARILEMEIGG